MTYDYLPLDYICVLGTSLESMWCGVRRREVGSCVCVRIADMLWCRVYVTKIYVIMYHRNIYSM